MSEEQKRTLVNGVPQEAPDEAAVDQGGDVPPEGDSGGDPEPSRTPPTSGGEIKDRAKSLIDRVKKDGPEPIREAAKGLVDKAFDTVDAAFDKWFGAKK